MGQTNLDQLGLFEHQSNVFAGAGDGPFSFASVVYKKEDTLVTSAQVLALNATPQTVVAAPGASQALIFDGALIFLDFNANAYAGVAAGEDLVFRYTGSGNDEVSAQIETTGFLDQTNDETRYAVPAGVNGTVLDFDLTDNANEGIQLALLVGEVITGDSPLKVRVFYRQIDLASLVNIS